jgi:thioredoxin reductase (NADPH)
MSVPKMLKGHEFFRSLPVEEVNRISAFSSVKKFAKGEMVYVAGRPASHTFVLLKGRVHLRLPAAAGDASLVIDRVCKGDLFGIAPLLGSKRYTTSAYCEDSCEVMAIEAAPLLKLLGNNPLVEKMVMTEVAKIYFSRYEEALGRLQNILNQLTGGD